MRPLSPTLSKLPVIVCGSPSSPLGTNCTSTVSSIQSLSFTMPPSALFSTRLLSPKHPTPQGSGLRRILQVNFHEKAHFVKADVAAPVSSATTLCPSLCFHPHFW